MSQSDQPLLFRSIVSEVRCPICNNFYVSIEQLLWGTQVFWLNFYWSRFGLDLLGKCLECLAGSFLLLFDLRGGLFSLPLFLSVLLGCLHEIFLVLDVDFPLSD